MSDEPKFPALRKQINRKISRTFAVAAIAGAALMAVIKWLAG